MKAIIRDLDKQDFSVNDLKNTIKSIRSVYTREMAKVHKSEKSGSGTDDVYKPQYLRTTCNFTLAGNASLIKVSFFFLNNRCYFREQKRKLFFGHS